MTRAPTLEGLKDGERKQIYEDSEPSRCCNVWAPEMHYIDGAFVPRSSINTFHTSR